ncbi:MAG: hypothetical protein BMS9Abin01_0692 [Gammaproteobacteria bacterium]|nr:MAG: hypothetical protein BMS9Abin01_0692 [Gammaproteobacteria bacterium]
MATEGAYPPFNFYDTNNNLVGFDIEITNALCAKIKVKCSIVAQDWDGIIPGLLANKYDAIIASMSITEERKKKVAFTKKYYASPPRFVAAKSASVTDTSPAALKGKTVGVQSATTHSNYIETYYQREILSVLDLLTSGARLRARFSPAGLLGTRCQWHFVPTRFTHRPCMDKPG